MENPNKPEEKVNPAPERRPNESGSVQVDAFMRIFDPKSKEVFVEGRA